MVDVMVFQSAPPNRPDWVAQCMDSVAMWAAENSFGYQFLGDELFELIPDSYRCKVEGRGPILADLARLQLLEQHLGQHGGRAIWLDADVLSVDAQWRPTFGADSLFGEECWVQAHAQRGWRTYINPHNAYLSFTADSVVLPFLRHITQSIIERADPAHIAPQMVGPKLLKHLHSLADFTLSPEVGALSPVLLEELVAAPNGAVACYRAQHRSPLKMINLCHSLVANAPSQRESLTAFLADPRRYLELLVG
jgi:hypothetical protein